MSPDRHARTMLPIPDRPAVGLTTYDAKDPATTYPPIEHPPTTAGAAPSVSSSAWTSSASVSIVDGPVAGADLPNPRLKRQD